MVDQVGPTSPHAAGQLSLRRPMASQNPLQNEDLRELYRPRGHPYPREALPYPPLLDRDGLQLWNATYSRREAPGLARPEGRNIYGSHVPAFAPWDDVDNRQRFTPYPDDLLRPWGYRDRYGQLRRYQETPQMACTGEYGDYLREAPAPQIQPSQDRRATHTNDNHDSNSVPHERSPDIQPGPSSSS
jgi:hypothetical protein